ncbi:MAG TPA: tyrosine-type recombinase/integrase [Thermoleophilaceae bacterium]|jgi:integrase|nr:tyrosine-type recombinase/integrase [Thermoleophilaceae bacterium]
MAATHRAGRRPEGISLRHASRCRSRADEPCDCRPTYQAQVYSPRDRKTLRKTFRSLSDARAWRSEAQTALNRGTLRAPSRTTLAEAAEQWLSAAEAGIVRTRSGDAYKPSALRAYEQALRQRLLPALGHMKLSALTRNAVQDVVDRLVAEGQSASTVRNAVLPLRAIYRRSLSRSEVHLNPTEGLTLPAVRGRRDRVARPSEARALIAALPQQDRAVWATALYAGLRRGELAALRWEDVDLERGVICVERSWDQRAGPVEPKSRSGRRRVPLAGPLRAHLAAHRLLKVSDDSLVFGRTGDRALHSEALTRRARTAWRRAGLEPIGLHECRHTYAGFMIAAGINAKALCAYMGHSSITITLDRYGHLMPGSEAEAAGMLGAYLERERGGRG